MVSIGRGIRWYRPYAEKVQFCLENQSDFMQVWYRDGELLLQNTPEDAVLDPIDFSVYGDTCSIP